MSFEVFQRRNTLKFHFVAFLLVMIFGAAHLRGEEKSQQPDRPKARFTDNEVAKLQWITSKIVSDSCEELLFDHNAASDLEKCFAEQEKYFGIQSGTLRKRLNEFLKYLAAKQETQPAELAELEFAIGNFANAEQLYLSLAKSAREKSLPADASRFYTRAGMAALYDDEPARAIDHLQFSAKLFDSNTDSTTRYENNSALSVAWIWCDENEKGIEALQKGIELYRSSRNFDRWVERKLHYKLADRFLLAHRYEEAVSEFRQLADYALVTYKLPDYADSTGQILGRLTEARILAGHGSDAIVPFRNFYEGCEEKFGAEHKTVLYLKAFLEYYEFRINPTHDALRRLESVHDSVLKKIQDDERRVFYLRYQLAYCYGKLDQHQKAHDLLKTISETRKSAYAKTDPSGLSPVTLDAYALTSLGKDDKAIGILKAQIKSVEAAEKGHRRRSTLDLMTFLADQHAYKADMAEAIELYETIGEECEQKYGTETRKTISVKTKLAKAYMHHLRFNDAETLQIEILDSLKKTRSESSSETAEVMYHLACTSYHLRKYQKALSLAQEACDIQAAHDINASWMAESTKLASCCKEILLKAAEEKNANIN